MSFDSRITVVSNSVEDAEDIFSTGLGQLFPEATVNLYGEPGATVIYNSFFHGDLKLSAPDPHGEDERKLFAHYLWNASIYTAMALELSNTKCKDGAHTRGDIKRPTETINRCDSTTMIRAINSKAWTVEGHAVLELGAGLGLAGIVASLSGASRTVISDYPSPEVLKTLRQNVATNVPKLLAENVEVIGHSWGKFEDNLSTSHGRSFTRIIAADCFWMSWEHENLARSLVHFLSREPSARVYVTAGLHTGRAVLAQFFKVAGEHGLEIEQIEEIDINGSAKPWASNRNDSSADDTAERSRWLVIAVLKQALCS